MSPETDTLSAAEGAGAEAEADAEAISIFHGQVVRTAWAETGNLHP